MIVAVLDATGSGTFCRLCLLAQPTSRHTFIRDLPMFNYVSSPCKSSSCQGRNVDLKVVPQPLQTSCIRLPHPVSPKPVQGASMVLDNSMCTIVLKKTTGV